MLGNVLVPPVCRWEPARCRDKFLGVHVLFLIDCYALRFWRQFPERGGHLARLVLQSPKTTPQERGAAHGPLHPMVLSFSTTFM